MAEAAANREMPKRVLLVRPSALGDVCRSVGVAAALKRAWPEAKIDWLVQDSFVDAVSAHPAVTDVVPFARRGLGRSLVRGNPGPLLKLIGRLQSRRYAIAIDAQGLFRSAFLAKASGAATVVGYRGAPEFASLLYSHRVHAPVQRAAVKRMHSLVESLGIDVEPDLRLYTEPAWHNASQGLPKGYAVIAPTSRWPAKRWPIARFAQFVRRLLAWGVPGVAVVGGPGEDDQCEPLLEMSKRDSRIAYLVGKTSVGELMALIERSSLVVANDSAAVHMAVGFARPMVALYGPTDVVRVGPYARQRDVLQRVTPSDRLSHKRAENARLMERILVQDVFDAATARLAAGR